MPARISSSIPVLIRYGLMILSILLVFGVILALAGSNPLESYRDIFLATLGSAYGLSEVLVAMTPLLLTALAAALPWKVGLINVGGEGQMIMGAAGATWVALNFPTLPPFILLPLMVLLGMLGGAAWAFVPGYLRGIGRVNETITTLLANSIAPSLLGFLIFGFWHSPMDTVKTANFVPAAHLPTFGGTRVHMGLVFGLVLVGLLWAVMKYTRWGLEMRAIGGNALAARYGGLPVKRYWVTMLCLGGAVSGLAGMAQVSGFYGVLLLNFSGGAGFLGFLICWLASAEPLGILLMAFVVAVITTGSAMLQLTQNIPSSVINILLALVLFIVLADPGRRNRRRA